MPKFSFRSVGFTLALLSSVALMQPVVAAETKKEESSSTYELLNLFGEVFDRVRTDYVEPVSDQKLIESALNGMLTSLDPHSSYLNEKSFNDMKITNKGEFGGLGIEVTMENGLVRVVSPIDDTPAARAGIKPGDFISVIDDVPVMGITLQEAVDKMRGTIGTSIKITVLREGAREPMNLTLKRELIKIQSVRSRAEGNIVYLRITSFAENTADTMIAAYEKEKKAINGPVKGVVLDLRNNPGGLLDQAIAMADAFLEKGEIVSTRSRNPDDSRRFNATSGDITNGLPMVVMINEGSASASEIVAGALKDHKRAVILGAKSFGKGSVQTVLPIDDHGAIRLTTARYYTPAGISIQATGIVPDIQVKQAKVEAITSNLTISESVLRGHLSNDQDRKETDSEGKPVDLSKIPDAVRLPEATKGSEAGKTSPFSKNIPAEQDYQLSRALDLINALSIYQKNAVDGTPSVTKPTEAKPTTSKPAKPKH